MDTRMMRLTFFASLLCLTVSCKKSDPVSPAIHPTVALDSTVNGQSLIYPLNQQLSLQLDVHADGGYQWDISMTDTSVVCLDSTSFRPKSGNPNQLGGLTIETIYFCTMKIGRSVVTLIEHRIWEQNIPPIHSATFTVNVHD